MLYFWLKYIHILSSTILFGTGIGTASVMLYGHLSKNINSMAVINQYVVKVDWLFTGVSGILQLLTGFWMIFLAGYRITAFWILGSLFAYVLTAICWFIVVYLQIKIRDITVAASNNKQNLPLVYQVYFRWWFILGCPAFLSLLFVFYLMVIKPFRLNML